MKLKFTVALFCFLFCNFLSAQDSLIVEHPCKGVEYKNIIKKDVPLSIHLLKINLEEEGIDLNVGIANDAVEKGGEIVSSFVNRHQNDSEKIIAAVNADFFGGNPLSAQNCMIVNGEFAKGVKLNRTLFGITKNKKPFAEKIIFDGKLISGKDTLEIEALNNKPDNLELAVFNKFYGNKLELDSGYSAILLNNLSNPVPNQKGKVVVEEIISIEEAVNYNNSQSVLLFNDELASKLSGISEDDTLQIYLGTNPFVEGIQALAGGLPGLIKDGKIPDTYLGKEGLSRKGFLDRHPRTAVGFSKDHKTIFIVVIDGRQPELSIGIGLKELAEYLLSIGCWNAVNFDGGGSSAMVVNNKVVNSPSDKTGERPVHNYLYVTYSLN